MDEDRAPLIVAEGTQWVLARVYTHGIRFPVSPRGCILQVINPVVLGHPGSFYPTLSAHIVPAAVAFPDMGRLKAEKVFIRAGKFPQVRSVEFDPINTVRGAARIIQVDPVIIVNKNRRVKNAPIPAAATDVALQPLTIFVYKITKEFEGT
jgi:hypothetical protein